MDQIHKQVQRAQRRLVIEQWLSRLTWCLFAGLMGAALFIALPKVLVIEGLPANWEILSLAVGAAAGLVAAIIWSIVSHYSALDSAAELDRRFGLRERVASSLSLSGADLESEAGQALLKDALRSVKRVEVSEKFRVRPDRRAWLPLVPAMIAFALITFVGNREATSSVEEVAAAAEQEQTQNALEELRKRIEEQKKKAEESGNEELAAQLEELEQGTRELRERDQVNRVESAAKLNDLKEQLEQRKQQLGGKEQLQKQFEQMKEFGEGPGEGIAKAMKEGDWKKAMEGVKDLQEKIAAGDLTEEEKNQLVDQLQKMQDKLNQLAQAHEQAMENLKKQIEEQRRQGNLAKAGELQRKLDQMQQQMPQMQRLAQMAQMMAQAQQNMQEGDGQQAAQAMEQLAQQLGQMQNEMQELQMLEAALAQLEMAKNAMGCEACNGMGCAACQGMGMAQMWNPNPGMGQGMGRGRGAGPRPDEENATNLRDSQVRGQVGRGASTFGGLVDGPNEKGQIAAVIKEEMLAEHAEAADPLAAENLPRSRREHATEYFQSLRDGN